MQILINHITDDAEDGISLDYTFIMARFTQIILTGTFLSMASTVYCQTFAEMRQRLGSVLAAKYQHVDLDTNYVVRPQAKWTLVGRMNISGAGLRGEGNRDGQHFESEMRADMKTTLSAGVSYMGLSLGMAVNPAKMLGKYNDYELNLRSYGKRLGFDIAYQDAHNFTGWHQVDEGERTALPADMLKLRTLNVNGYYIFNQRRFSYPAAFAHSYMQRRSAGSMMLALSGQGQRGETQTGKILEQEQQMKFDIVNIGIGAGYGYNYVPADGWLLHLSALPTFIVYSNTSLTMGNTEVPLHYHFPEVILTGRGAVVKQLKGNKFAGIQMVFNFTSIGNEERLNIKNDKWLVRAYFGIRLPKSH